MSSFWFLNLTPTYPKIKGPGGTDYAMDLQQRRGGNAGVGGRPGSTQDMELGQQALGGGNANHNLGLIQQGLICWFYTGTPLWYLVGMTCHGHFGTWGDPTLYGAFCLLFWLAVLSTTGMNLAIVTVETMPSAAALAFGITPLHVACYRGEERKIFHLMSNGADPDLEDAFGYTPRLFFDMKFNRRLETVDFKHELYQIIAKQQSLPPQAQGQNTGTGGPPPPGAGAVPVMLGAPTHIGPDGNELPPDVIVGQPISQVTALKKCINTSCQKMMKQTAKFCPSCGVEQVDNQRRCDTCRHPLQEGERFCPECGKDSQKETGGAQPEFRQVEQAD